MTKMQKGKYQHKDAYLNAALEIIRKQGVDKLTMRKVAQHLDVSPMAIYKHFASKDELLKAMLDSFIERANVLPENELTWQEWVSHVAHQMASALQGDPLWLTLLGALNVGDKALAVTQAFLQKLIAAGFSTEAALEAYIATLQLVMGAVVMQSIVTQRQEKLASTLAIMPALTGTPLHALLGKPQIDVGLIVLLQGLETILQQQSPP